MTIQKYAADCFSLAHFGFVLLSRYGETGRDKLQQFQHFWAAQA